MNASVYRDTEFELSKLVQGPNSFGVVAIPRGVAPTPNEAGGLTPPPAIPLELPEGLFTDEEMAVCHQALRIWEEKYAIVHAGWRDAPARVTEAISKAVEAESRRKLAELKALELEALQAQKLAELTALDEEIAAKRGGPK
jgi:hypothetical protein